MLSLGSNNVDGCNGVPYPTTPGAKAELGPGYNGTIPSGSFACYSSPNALGSLCCGQIEGKAYDWCGWAACVVSNRTAWETCIERNGLAANGVSPTQKCVTSSARARRAGVVVALMALGVLAVS
ncbi:hypothetical protein CspHIS471_0108630 [Cutaneotrichosporon sp. HIS471]|nr:hypothetical protein CspHIS471_0108630 [Cutaneotrichosporon sp. HIS471]